MVWTCTSCAWGAGGSISHAKGETSGVRKKPAESKQIWYNEAVSFQLLLGGTQYLPSEAYSTANMPSQKALPGKRFFPSNERLRGKCFKDCT